MPVFKDRACAWEGLSHTNPVFEVGDVVDHATSLLRWHWEAVRLPERVIIRRCLIVRRANVLEVKQ